MKKPEREALREYVAAVCQFSELQGLASPDPRAIDAPRVSILDGGSVRTLNLNVYRTETATRLNAADDRLRALGMLA